MYPHKLINLKVLHILQFRLFVLFVLFLVFPLPFTFSAEPNCTECHSMEEVFPEGHIKLNSIEECARCHERVTGAGKNQYSVKMHKAHLDAADCLLCHEWEDDKHFTIKGGKSFGSPNKETYGVIKKEIMPSWLSSGFIDNIHADVYISCGGCHGEQLPEFYAKISNDRCLTCHGPVEKLVEKTVGKISEARNVHHSKHYGIEAECIVCHRGHMPSQTLCFDCHKNFGSDINPIPGQGK